MNINPNTLHVNNGRVDISNNHNDAYPYILSEQKENEITSYKDALTGTISNTILSRAFFSKENIELIHNGIRAGVYHKSNGNYVIGNQNIDNIKIIMRSIFIEYARHKPNITNEIEELNRLVLDQCIHDVFNEVNAYMKYKKDVSTLVVPNDRPKMTNVTGSKQLQPNHWI